MAGEQPCKHIGAQSQGHVAMFFFPEVQGVSSRVSFFDLLHTTEWEMAVFSAQHSDLAWLLIASNARRRSSNEHKVVFNNNPK